MAQRQMPRSDALCSRGRGHGAAHGEERPPRRMPQHLGVGPAVGDASSADAADDVRQPVGNLVRLR